jgi:hypothetical protein
MQVVKKSTGTFTAEEAKEFAEFQKSRSQFCEPFMKAVPAHTGNTNLAASKRKTKFTEPQIPKKRRHYGRQPGSRPRPLLPNVTIPALMDVTVVTTSEPSTTPPVPDTAGSGDAPDTAKCPEGPATITPPATPDSDLPDVQDILNQDLAISDSVYDRTTIVSEKKADEVSILTDGIIDPEPYEPALPQKQQDHPTYTASSKRELKLKAIAIQQTEIISLNVGGTVFTTSKQTLQADPASILASLVSDKKIMHQNQNALFLDRNPKHYGKIIDYMRNHCSTDSYFIPQDPKDICDLLKETKFLELDDLSRTLEGRIREYSSSNL